MSLADTISGDLATIFEDNFTISALHQYGAESETLKVFFDPKSELALSGAVVISEQSISISIRTAQAGNVTKDSQFTINNTAYNVFDIGPDIEGITKIDLTEATP